MRIGPSGGWTAGFLSGLPGWCSRWWRWGWRFCGMGDFRIGFSGSSELIMPAQRMSILHTFTDLQGERPESSMWLHHGDCVVGDEAAHDFAAILQWHIEIHPPIIEAKRAFCQGADIVHEPR